MGGFETDTIRGFNAFVQKLRRTEGEGRITAEKYYVRGSTTLLNAVGKTILDVNRRLSLTVEDERPGKVVVVITTDDLENASHEFTFQKIEELIQHQQAQYGWEFIFLGANIDAVKEANHIGIEVSPYEAAIQHQATYR